MKPINYLNFRFDIAHARSKIIVVVKGDLPHRQQMPDGLYDYIKTNTYLSWKDPWFWQKLRYALPHKGARVRCLESFFGRRQQTDQLHLIQNGSSRTLASPQPNNGFSSLNHMSVRNNSVSPI